MADKNSGMSNWIDDLSFKRLLLHPITLMLLATILTISVGSMLWQQHRTGILKSQDYLLTPGKVELPEHPDWVPSDWTQVAFRDSRLNEISLLENDAAEKVSGALSVQPWIKQVNRVEKTRSNIIVDLSFRKPVAMVEVGNQSLIPVDDESVILDGTNFTAEHTRRVWRISIPLPTAGPTIGGQPWPDTRIEGAAAIAAAWDDSWQELGLLRVVNRSSPNLAKSPFEKLADYEIWTRNELPIIWGRPPGWEREGEATAAVKIAALQEFVKQNGGFGRVPSSVVLDIRTGSVMTKSMSLSRNFDATFK